MHPQRSSLDTGRGSGKTAKSRSGSLIRSWRIRNPQSRSGNGRRSYCRGSKRARSSTLNGGSVTRSAGSGQGVDKSRALLDKLLNLLKIVLQGVDDGPHFLQKVF